MKKEKKQTYHLINWDLSKEISHGICVSNLAYKVGKKLLLDEKTCYNLAVMGLLHDVGKQEMVRNVFKRGEDQILRIEEMRYIRTHPVLGYAILKEQGYPQEQVNWVLYHHENYDGSGYPDNRKAEQIPLGARIMRVADAFAALISERPYREAYDFDNAISIMIEDIKEYDMQVFLAFMDVIHDDGLLESIKQSQASIDYDMEEFNL